VTVPTYVVVVQWVFLLALGAIIIIMYRHLGRLLGSPRSSELGPAPGNKAANFEYIRLSDETAQHMAPGSGEPLLLAFVEPTCQSCEDLVATLNTASSAGELDALRVLLMVSDPPQYLPLSDAFATTELEIGRIVDRTTLRAYNASATPLLVAIDAKGLVRSAGPARDLNEVRAFISASVVIPPEVTIPITAAVIDAGK